MYKNIIFALLMMFTFGANAQYVDIPDYSFRRCLKENYPQLMNGDQLDVAAAEKYDGKLDLSKKRIRDLSGIENFKKLKQLDCSYNELISIDVKKLTKLEDFDCRYNRLKEVKGLNKSKKIKKGYFAGNFIDDLDDLDKSNDLKESDLGSNKIGYWKHDWLKNLSDKADIDEFKHFRQKNFGKKERKAYTSGEKVKLEVPKNNKAVGYQWYKNGVKIDGATDYKYEFDNFDGSKSGDFSCRVLMPRVEEKTAAPNNGNGGAGDPNNGNNGDGANQDECGECDGKATKMSLLYNGNSGHVVITMKDGTVVYEGDLDNGGIAYFEGTDKKGTLGTEITITIDGQTDTKIHTSCSVPLEIGLEFGSFTLIDGESRNGGRFCNTEGGHQYKEQCDCDQYESEVIIVTELSCENIDLELNDEDIIDRTCAGADGMVTFTVSNGAAHNLYRIRKKDEFGDYQVFTAPTYVNLNNYAGEAKEVTLTGLDAGDYDLYAYCGSDPSEYDVRVFTIGKEEGCPDIGAVENCGGIEVILDKTRIIEESAVDANDVSVTFKIRNGSENNLYRIRKRNNDGVYIPLTAPAYVQTGNALGEEPEITINNLGAGTYDIYAYCGTDGSEFHGTVFQIFVADPLENCEGISLEVDSNYVSGLRFDISEGSIDNYYRVRRNTGSSYEILTTPTFVNAQNSAGDVTTIDFGTLDDGVYDVYAYCGSDPSNFVGYVVEFTNGEINCRVANEAGNFVAEDEQTSINELDDDFASRIYPNPTDHELNIELAGLGDQEESRVRIFTTDGRLVYNEVYKVGDIILNIDVSKWTAGLYYLEIRFLNREPIHDQIVVE